MLSHVNPGLGDRRNCGHSRNGVGPRELPPTVVFQQFIRDYVDEMVIEDLRF
jgi:hypothetical protein